LKSRETLSLIEKDLNRLPPNHFTVTSAPIIPLNSNRRNDRVQLLSQILFVYAKEYPVIGYRQGMHEILSFILLALEIDFESNTNGIFWERHQIGHDAFAIFELVMYYLSPAYDPMADVLNAPPRINVSKPKNINMSTICQGIFTKIKQSGDVQLYTFLTEQVNIPPQLYCTRWVRLLFVREIASISKALLLWDAIFEFLKSMNFMECVEFVAGAMILLIRSELMTSNDAPNDAIQNLMNYPAVENVDHLLDKFHLLNRLQKQNNTKYAQPSKNYKPVKNATSHYDPLHASTVSKVTHSQTKRQPSIQQTVKHVTHQWSKQLEHFGSTIAEAVVHPRPTKNVDEKLRKSNMIIVEFLKGCQESGHNVPQDVWEAVNTFENVRGLMKEGTDIS